MTSDTASKLAHAVYTSDDIARLLNANVCTVRKWTANGSLWWAWPFKTPGGQYRYVKSAVDERLQGYATGEEEA